MEPQAPPAPVVPDSETMGWFDPSRDGGFIRRAGNSYLADPGDAWVPPHVVRQHGLRQGDLVTATSGRDHRNRHVLVEVQTINGVPAAELGRRPDFQSLTATYPEKRLTMETGRPAKGGPELTRRCIDLMSPIGYGQRALIVAPADREAFDGILEWLADAGIEVVSLTRLEGESGSGSGETHAG